MSCAGGHKADSTQSRAYLSSFEVRRFYYGFHPNFFCWNLFFQDCDLAVASTGHSSAFFADDLHAYKVYERTTSLDAITQDCENCRVSVHRWGEANQVVFDGDKESVHVLSQHSGVASSFKFLGCVLDSRLQMQELITDLTTNCNWKIASILRVRRFHSTLDLINLYKAQILGYIEYRTGALYHAGACHLEPLDLLQTKFLHSIGVSIADALLTYNLAPLGTRRDMALLGLIHKCAIGGGPPHFKQFFSRAAGTTMLLNPYSQPPFVFGPFRRTSALLTNSAVGLIPVYNSLAEFQRRAETVPDFQGYLQEYIKSQCRIGLVRWDKSLCPRHFGR